MKSNYRKSKSTSRGKVIFIVVVFVGLTGLGLYVAVTYFETPKKLFEKLTKGKEMGSLEEVEPKSPKTSLNSNFNGSSINEMENLYESNANRFDEIDGANMSFMRRDSVVSVGGGASKSQDLDLSAPNKGSKFFEVGGYDMGETRFQVYYTGVLKDKLALQNALNAIMSLVRKYENDVAHKWRCLQKINLPDSTKVKNTKEVAGFWKKKFKDELGVELTLYLEHNEWNEPIFEFKVDLGPNFDGKKYYLKKRMVSTERGRVKNTTYIKEMFEAMPKTKEGLVDVEFIFIESATKEVAAKFPANMYQPPTHYCWLAFELTGDERLLKLEAANKDLRRKVRNLPLIARGLLHGLANVHHTFYHCNLIPDNVYLQFNDKGIVSKVFIKGFGQMIKTEGYQRNFVITLPFQYRHLDSYFGHVSRATDLWAYAQTLIFYLIGQNQFNCLSKVHSKFFFDLEQQTINIARKKKKRAINGVTYVKTKAKLKSLTDELLQSVRAVDSDVYLYFTRVFKALESGPDEEPPTIEEMLKDPFLQVIVPAA